MNEILITIFLVLLGVGWIFIFFRHFYLIRFPFSKYMSLKYPKEWENMKNDTNWTPSWRNPYFSYSVYKFIWKSDENLGDRKISEHQKIIRNSGWHIMLYFLFAGIVGAIMVIIDMDLR